MERVFANGAYFKEKPQAPEWVIGGLSIKVDDFISCLKENQNEEGYVNFDIKKSKDGKTYIEVDTWRPEKAAPKAEEPTADNNPDDDDLPF